MVHKVGESVMEKENLPALVRKYFRYLEDQYRLSKMAILPKGRFDPKRRIGTNVVVLEPEIAKAFPNDEAVNEALRLVLKVSKIPHSS
jgi:hypothetical protein